MDGNKTLASLYSEGTEPGSGGGIRVMSGGNGGQKEAGSYKVAKWDFEHISTPYIVCMWILLASAMKVGYHHFHMYKVLPESCILILFGIILGFTAYEIEFQTSDTTVVVSDAVVERDASFSLTSNTFFFYLLPPIVLDAGYFMPNRAFFDNLGTILLYAVVGTLFNIFAVGFALYGMMQLGAVTLPEGTELLQLLIFATVVSAVDPVAVLAVFEEISVNQILHIIVFGESLLNDAVTVVLYHMLEDFSTMSGVPTAGDMAKGLLSFFVVAVGGASVGVVWGMLTGLLTKFTSHVRLVEPLVIFGMAYFSYLVAELFHLSGIMAIVFCGITMKQYVEANISQKSHTTVKYFLKMTSNASETVIFAFLGLSALDIHHHEWNGGLVFFTLLFCLVFRFLGVILLTWLANRKRVAKMDRVSQFVMGYGGIRGAVTYSLVILLDGRHVKGRNMMITAAIALIFFTCFIQGVTIKPFVELLKIKRRTKKKPTLTEQMNEKLMDHVMAGMEDIAGFTGHHYLRDKFEHLDGKYLKPILLSEPPVTKDSAILDTFTKLNLKDAVDRVVGPQQPFPTMIPPRDWIVAPAMMTSPTGMGQSRQSSSSPRDTAATGNNAAEPAFPRVTDRYGHGDMDEDAMHNILEHNVIAPRQFAVYKRADIADDESVVGLDELRQRRESVLRRASSPTGPVGAATAAAAALKAVRHDGDSSTSSPHNHRLEDINEHRSGRHHHHRHHHHRHHHSSTNGATSSSRLTRRRRGDHMERSPPQSLADDSPIDSGASHSSQHSELHNHNNHHHNAAPSSSHSTHQNEHRHHHHHHHHHGSSSRGGGGGGGVPTSNVVSSGPDNNNINTVPAATPSFHLHGPDDDEDGDFKELEEENPIEDSVIPDGRTEEGSGRAGHHHHVLRAIKSAYELPTPSEAEERKRRISANREEMPGNTATETTLPWRKDDTDENASDQAAKSALVFRSQSHSTLHQLAAAAEDSLEPPSPLDYHLHHRHSPNLSRPSSTHQLSSMGTGGEPGSSGVNCGGSTSATAATSEAASTPEVSLHHNDPIYSRHRASHGSSRHHEMSLQECQLALDVAVDEADEDAASPEDRAALHHSANPKLMRKRGELFEWSQRHKAPKENQEEEEHPFARIHSWLQCQSEQLEDEEEDFTPMQRSLEKDYSEAFVDDQFGAEEEEDVDDETAGIEAGLRSVEVSDNEEGEDDQNVEFVV